MFPGREREVTKNAKKSKPTPYLASFCLLTKTFRYDTLLLMKPNRLPRISIETKVKVVTDYKAGLLISEIMQRHNISKATLYRIIRMKI